MNYEPVDIIEDYASFEISVSGLLGGHSGMDIDKGRGNANKILNRILYHILGAMNFQLLSFDGGSLRNAIPREAKASIAIDHEFEGQLEIEFSSIVNQIKNEFKAIEKSLEIRLTPMMTSSKAVPNEVRDRIINTLYSVHNGVFRMSPDIENLVEASSSLARVIVSDGQFITQSLQRSSVESSKDDVANTIRTAFENAACAVVQSGDYPGWQPNPNSEILKVMTNLYRTHFNDEPKVKACHAGLECGILGKHLPGTDMISFGPNIRAAHSPDEKVQISSVQKFWSFYLEVLKQTPSK
jgi:dipeptidase D